MAFGKVFNKGGTDKTVIYNVRAGNLQKFQAPDWVDLRVGFLVSITDKTNDDLITGLGPETITVGAQADPYSRYYFGVTDHQTLSSFIGYSNSKGVTNGTRDIGDSMLVSSDIGIGTTNTNFWRPKNSVSNVVTALIKEAGIFRAQVSTGGTQLHLVQNTGGAGGYATLVAIRLQRANPLSTTITATFPTNGVNSGDVLFTNTPTEDLLRTNLIAFPTQVRQLGPVQLNNAPSVFYIFWPFVNSRIRVHCAGIYKAR